MIVPCISSGWGGVNFSSLYGTVFWICDYNSVDNRLMC